MDIGKQKAREEMQSQEGRKENVTEWEDGRQQQSWRTKNRSQWSLIRD